MPSIFRRSEASHDGDPEYQATLQSFASEISGFVQIVEERKRSLRLKYPKEGLISLSDDFYGIAEWFIKQGRTQTSTYGRSIRRSAHRKAAVGRIITAAKNTAKLFERCASKPAPYSRVEARVKIDILLAELGNLLSSINLE